MIFDISKLEDFPTQPGVYFMKDAKGAVIYVGKANNIKVRLKQYFVSGSDDRIQIPYLLEQVVTIDTIVVSSEKEALLLENTLIKRHRPKYNVLLKDDKSYLSFKISKHKYPLMQLVRYKGLPPSDGRYFGPYTSSLKARAMFDLVSRTFPLRQCSDEEFARRTRPCLLYQINRCPAPCVHICTDEEYQSNVENATRLLKGQNQVLIAELKKEMLLASDALEFEKAAKLLQKIQLLESTKDVQNVQNISAESLDAIGIYREGDEVVISILIWRTSRLEDVQHFEFANVIESNQDLLNSFLLQHYLQQDPPPEIVLSHEIDAAAIVAEILSERRGKKVVVSTPQKGDKKQLALLAQTNAEAAFRQRKDSHSIKQKLLLDMQEKLSLSRFPRRIECFDNSHLFGQNPVAAMVVFVNGEKYKQGYRKFHIKSAPKGDDYAMFREVLQRRFEKVKNEATGELPDLLIIDGGKAHYNLACKILSDLDIVSCDIIAVAKEEGRHDKGLSQERIFHPEATEPILLSLHSPILLLLQQIRDETHRFAITFHKQQRKKSTIKSVLDDIPGIGPVKKKKLLQTFGSVKAILELSVAELCKVPGITKKDAEMVLGAIRKSISV